MSNRQRNILTYVFMNTIMCICTAATALLVNVGTLTLPMYVVTLLEALIICNLCTLIFRIPSLSIRAAMALGRGDPSSKAVTALNGLFNATLNNFFMNTFMTLINVGFRSAYFPAWLHGFPVLELVAVIVSFVVAPIASKIVLTYFPPA